MKFKIFIVSFILATFCSVMAVKLSIAYSNSKVDSDMILSVYNNIAGKGDSNLKKDWGLSFWIDYNGKIVLFDTGMHGNLLLDNLESLGLTPSKIHAVVISHDHFDHSGGLSALQKVINKDVPVYIPEKAFDDFEKEHPGFNIVAVDGPVEIIEGVASTGQIEGRYNGKIIFEQALIIKGKEGNIVLTGCSHPPVDLIAETVKKQYPESKTVLIAGGYHLAAKSMEEVQSLSERLKSFDVLNIAPSHCTGAKVIEYLKGTWGDNFINLNLGDKFYILKN